MASLVTNNKEVVSIHFIEDAMAFPHVIITAELDDVKVWVESKATQAISVELL